MRYWYFRARRRFRLPVIILLIATTLATFMYLSTTIERPSEPPSLPDSHFNIPESEFINSLRSVLLEQYALYATRCNGSDIFRPGATPECKNTTFTSELSLASLPAFSLLDSRSAPPVFAAVPTFTNRKGVEIGRIADYVIAPLISTYLVSNSDVYLKHAVEIGSELVQIIGRSLPKPFVGHDKGEFGFNEVFVESVSSIYPVLASLAYHTRDKKFSDPIRRFVQFLGKQQKKHQLPAKYRFNESNKGVHENPLDIPFRVYSDLSRINRILPDVDTKDLLKLVKGFLLDKNPLTVFDVAEVYVYSIEPCSVLAYLSKDSGKYSALFKKCQTLVKHQTFPTRLRGSSEFGDYDLQTGFTFEGEMIEMFWRKFEMEKAKNLISNTLRECQFGSAVTGIRNTTIEGKRSDNRMHPEMFSRFLFNGVLIEAGINFNDIVLSHGGHLLKLTQPQQN
jgi:hypothetical protein